MALTYIQQNGSTGRNISYPSANHPTATISTSGCGVCSSLMVLLNSTSYSYSLANWTKRIIKAGGRALEGTDMGVVSKYMKNTFGISYTYTTNIDKVKAHLKKGYKAVANVGKKGYFSSSGHFVCLGGYKTDGKVIVLDPYYYTNKWTCTVNGINRSKYFTYNSTTHEVYCSFTTLKNDSYAYYLFTPSKKVNLKYSANDIKAVKTNKPVLKKGQNVKFIYSRKFYKTASSSGATWKISDCTRIKSSATITFKEGATFQVLAVNGNWAEIEYGNHVGFICYYDSKPDIANVKIV